MSIRSSSAQIRANLSPRQPTARHKRPNVWLGKAIPLILLVFVWKGWELVLHRISESFVLCAWRTGADGLEQFRMWPPETDVAGLSTP